MRWEARGLDERIREGGFLWSIGESGATLVDAANATGRVVVPDEVGGVPVTAVGARAFLGRDRLEAVTLPETVGEIGESAFYGCAALRWAVLPRRMASIGPRAFQGCESLRTIRLPEGLGAVAPRAFYLCRRLIEIDVSEGVRAIGEAAFQGCARLGRAGLPDGLESIGENAFAGCAALKELNIPASVTRICASSVPVQLCRSGSLYLPRQGLLVRAVASLRWAAPEGTRIIADAALAGNHDLTEVALPDGLEHIGARAFEDCRCLHAIRLPERVRSVGEAAFRGCAKLETAALPRTLTALPDRMFEDSGLARVELPDVVHIGVRAFAGCARLESAALGEDLVEIGPQAFIRCAKLKSLALPASLKRIGEGALAGCAALEELRLPGGAIPGLDRALTDLRRVCIVAPSAPPEAFPPLWRKRVCLGFALALERDIPVKAEAREACVAWLRAHAAALMADAAINAPLLHALLANHCLSADQARRLVGPAGRANRPEDVAALLNYIGRAGDGGVAPDELW